MKTNITLKIDSDILRDAKVLAAETGSSVSALVSEHLSQIVSRRRAYERAKKRALAQLREGMGLGWKRPASRDELHER